MKHKKRIGLFKLILAMFVLIVIVLFLREYFQLSKPENLMPKEKLFKKFSNDTEEQVEKPNLIKRIFGGGGGDGNGRSSSSGGSDYGGSSSTSSGTATIYTADLTICANAQDGNLCDGLDLAYGDGYKLACCSERSLCC